MGEILIEKKIYKAPETADEAVETLQNVATRTFAKLKGRGLTIIESWWDKNDSRLGPSKALFTSMIADVANQLNREVEDCINVLGKR